MNIRLIASVVIAALLFTGTGVAFAAPADPQQTTPAATQPATAAAQELTAEEAKAIALAHAALSADQVTGLKAKKDRENGLSVWEVEFRQGDWEFDYDVNAETGAIVKWEKDYDPPKNTNPGSDPNPTEPRPTDAPPATPQLLTAEEAQAIALAHAGLTADQVTWVKTELDRDDGRSEWDVDFRNGDYEYDYEIHAETGAVLKWDKEYDPPRKQETEPPAAEVPAEQPKTITAEEAKAIALAHAGLTAEEVRGLRAELDRERGRTEWEIEFRVGRWEYEYEINAETGEIIFSEKEWDD